MKNPIARMNALLKSIDESELSAEALQIWNAAVGRIKRNYEFDDQHIVDNLVVYIADIVDTIVLEEPEILTEGTDISYSLGSNATVSIHCSGKLNELVSVEMDDVVVDEANYTTRQGSTIVTFKSA